MNLFPGLSLLVMHVRFRPEADAEFSLDSFDGSAQVAAWRAAAGGRLDAKQ